MHLWKLPAKCHNCRRDILEKTLVEPNVKEEALFGEIICD
jgi:hypothetical protein